MKSLANVLSQIDTLFLDSAPVIYFVEEKEPFFSRVRPIFDQIDGGRITAISSPITLAECLFYPYKQHNEELAEAFNRHLVYGAHVRFIQTTAVIADLSARLRAKYHLGFADGLQVATAVYANCDAFLTNDKQLSRIQELQVIVLDEFQL